MKATVSACLAQSVPPRSVGRRRPRRDVRRAMLWATLLLLLLRCPRGGHGGRSLASPVQVRFLAETFHHVLHWKPGTNDTHGGAAARYDVQYKRYGHPSWTPASNCARTASHSCDLTNQTSRPLQRYYARVRMVIGNHTSNWTQTSSPFTPKEATLWLSKASLSVTGNQIHVSLRLPVHRWKNITSEDIYRQQLEYLIYVRRVSDGHQSVSVYTSLELDLPPLPWDERYCVSVEPRVASLPNPGKRTEEQCISIAPMEGRFWRLHRVQPARHQVRSLTHQLPAEPPELQVVVVDLREAEVTGTPPEPPRASTDQARTIVLPSFTLLSLAALGTLGTVWACVYVKKPTETPSVLKSLLKSSSSSPWVPNELPAWGAKDLVFCMEPDPVQHLSLSPKNCTMPDSRNHHRSAGVAAPPPLWAGGEAESPGRRAVVGGSGCSTDSGICLQEASGILHRLLSCKRLSWESTEEEGGSGGFCLKTDQVLQPDLSSGKMAELALEAEERRPTAEPPQALFSGYQKQLGGPSEALGSSKALSSTDEVAHSQPGLASGYLKQPSFVVPPSGLGDATLSQDDPGRTQRLAANLSPAVLGPLELLLGSPKTLLAGSFLQSPASPHLSLLHPSTPLSQDLDLPRCRM